VDLATADLPVVDDLQRAYVELRSEVRRFVARRVPAEAVDDLSQEIFLRMHEHADELRDTARVVPWAFRIARSVVTDHLRRKRPTTSLDAIEEPAAPEEDPKNYNAEMAVWFRAMMALLPKEYATALELTEIEGLTQKELAERMRLSLSGAKSRVQRGRKLLEGVLRACCDFELDARGNVIECSPREGGPCKSC
jgi:RNA polymerase sigma-70 factor (ECF subfamily)